MGFVSESAMAGWSAWKRSRARAILYVRPRITALIMAGMLAAAIFLGPWHMVLVRHESVRFTFAVWRKVSPGYVPQNGDYVLFTWKGVDPNNLGLKEGYSLVKRVGCVAGQKLESTVGGDFYCDGVFLGRARLVTPVSRRALVRANFDGSPIPEGKVFMIGDLETSYDSRYWGLADAADIYGTVSIAI